MVGQAPRVLTLLALVALHSLQFHFLSRPRALQQGLRIDVCLSGHPLVGAAMILRELVFNAAVAFATQLLLNFGNLILDLVHIRPIITI